MGKPLTADDVLPIVASLTTQERMRLIRLLSVKSDEAAAEAYQVAPVARDEFTSEGVPLSWDAEGWESIG
jgi:hypothetical protein